MGFNDARDREELEGFFSEHRVALMKFAHFLTGNHHDAQDLLGITAEKLAKSWGRSRNRNLPYAKKLMRNASVDIHRSRRSRPKEVALDGLDAGEGSFDLEHEAEVRARITRVMRSLSSRELEVFTLHAHEGMTFEEIAKRLYVSVTTVRNDWHGVSKRLRADG